MEILGVLLGAIVGIAILDVVFSALFMMLGAKLAAIDRVTFGKSVLAALGSSLVTWLATLVLSIIPVVGSVLGFFIGLLFALFVIRGVFSTTIGKAFLVWVFNILAKILAVVIAILTFAGGLFALLK